MNKRFALFLLIVPALLLAGCTSQPKKDLALEQIRAQLERLKADEDLQGYAPLALGEAERALRQAEASQGDDTQRLHLIYMADRRIQIARTIAQREQLEAEYDRLEAERNNLLVWASQLEAEQARLEAEEARMMSRATAEDAERARTPVAAYRPAGSGRSPAGQGAGREQRDGCRARPARSGAGRPAGGKPAPPARKPAIAPDRERRGRHARRRPVRIR